MAPASSGACRAVDLRDAIVARHLGVLSAREAPAKYRVPSRTLCNALSDLDGISAERLAANQASLIESSSRRQVFRWASEFTGASIQEGHGYTHWELRESFIQNATTCTSKKLICQELGTPPSGFHRFQKKALAVLKIKSMKLLKVQFALKEITAAKIRSTANSIEHQRKGQKPYLSADEEEAPLIIATAEIKGSHSQPVPFKCSMRYSRTYQTLQEPRSQVVRKGKSQLAYARAMSFAASMRESLG